MGVFTPLNATYQEADVLVGILLERIWRQGNTEGESRVTILGPSYELDASVLICLHDRVLSEGQRGYQNSQR